MVEEKESCVSVDATTSLPDDISELEAMAKSQMVRWDPVLCRAISDKLFELDRESWMGWFLRGLFMLGDGMPSSAIAVWSQATELMEDEGDLEWFMSAVVRSLTAHILEQSVEPSELTAIKGLSLNMSRSLDLPDSCVLLKMSDVLASTEMGLYVDRNVAVVSGLSATVYYTILMETDIREVRLACERLSQTSYMFLETVRGTGDVPACFAGRTVAEVCEYMDLRVDFCRILMEEIDANTEDRDVDYAALVKYWRNRDGSGLQEDMMEFLDYELEYMDGKRTREACRRVAKKYVKKYLRLRK